MSRRRYVYRPNPETGRVEAVEVTPDFQAHEERAPVYVDLYMDGMRATDGTDIGSRAKRRQYMQARGVADASDYTETWAKAEKQREAFYSPDAKHDTQTRREALIRAFERHRR